MRGGTSARRRGAVKRRRGALVQTLDLLRNFTRSISTVDVDVAVVRKEPKREGLHVQRRHSVLLFPIATSEIIHLLQFKLFSNYI